MADDPESLSVISKCTVFPPHKSTLPPLKLSVFDLSLLSFTYIRRGGLFDSPPYPVSDLLSNLKTSLSNALAHFPPLAGRLMTASNGCLYIDSNDAGVDFIHADASDLCMSDFLSPNVPDRFRARIFSYDGVASHEGLFRPLLAVQVTELADGVFIGCSMSHAVVDGTSYWNFFNSFAELSRGLESISKTPDFSRDLIPMSSRVPNNLPNRKVVVTLDGSDGFSQRFFSFSRESILKLKGSMNCELTETAEISSFQSLCALLWHSITRAKKIQPSETTKVLMAANCRQRLEPKLDADYFGNAVWVIPTFAMVGDVLGKGVKWCAEQLNKSVAAFDNTAVKKYIEDWELNQKSSLLDGYLDGATIIVGVSPRFPMYDIDFGWGRPLAIRSGRAAGFDGRVAAHPGREGNGSVDIDVMLAHETMAALESDHGFMQFVTGCQIVNKVT